MEERNGAEASERFVAREYPYGDREAWEVWDLEAGEIAEPLEQNVDLSQAEAEARAAALRRAAA